MQSLRGRERVAVHLAVTVTSVLESRDAYMVDLSRDGARLIDVTVPVGTLFQVEYLGQTVYAKCVWAEVDRMGIHFPFGLDAGPLYDAMMLAWAEPLHEERSTAVSAPTPSAASAGRRIPASFGRRSS
jgi:hypothetical protein